MLMDKPQKITRYIIHSKIFIFEKNITHLDLGPGLGDMCPTIKLEYNTKYIALESTPLTYSVQREFLKYLYYSNQSIYDVVEAEDFKSEKEIESDINRKEFDIIHLPSWHFKILKIIQ